MRIKTFNILVEREQQIHELKDCEVVIDGHNFFYNLYEQSKLPFAFGCESNRFATFLREYLGMFIKANVKCYFILKGGSEDIQRKFNKKIDRFPAKDYDPKQTSNDMVMPIFTKDVIKEVLDEMGFDYVICRFEPKKQCIALAQTVNCPLISNDIEFSFSNVPYIQHYNNSLRFNASKNCIECRVFHLDRFLSKYALTKEKIAMFIVLTDEHIFPNNFFQKVIMCLGIPLSNCSRNEGLLIWLSSKTRAQAMKVISKCLLREDHKKFLDKEKEAVAFVGRMETGGVPLEFLMNRNTASFTENDPLWFEKGVACRYIAIPYIDLYHSNVLEGSWAIEDTQATDGILLSLDIIKYANKLLTNYEKDNFEFYTANKEIINVHTNNDKVIKPNYEAETTVFENGWDERLRDLGLLEHFLMETLPGFDFQHLENLPEDSRLLMIALVYFSFKKSSETFNEVYSVLLSYVMLGVVTEENQNVLKSDCSLASDIMKKYFELNATELIDIFDRKIIHPLVELQHCLQHLNYLNALCGYPYKPTVYHKTYNGTFVYKILYDMVKHGDGLYFLTNILEPASTVLRFLQMLVEEYEEMILSTKRC